ncbi:MAG: ABC transporter ATP-binding protein [Candidatus Omnitrophica bacterium]|nr:ABC transporter ATP-binding protein [Candidatus Omnitrophota bacterium]
MSCVKVVSLQVNYDEVRAVDNISFELEKGRVYGFLGPNGSGKTSTIKALAGILEPACGEIILNGHDLATARQKALLKVGYMPDFAPVYENLQVWEYLDVFAAAYGLPSAERPGHISKWLEKTDLTSKKEALVRGLSRGMRQRLVFARTLLSTPDIILLDEPASGLDPISRKQMRDILKECRGNGAAILISSHILSELSEFVDSLIILEKGRLVMSGSIEDIRSRLGGGQKLALRFSRPEDGEIFRNLLAEENIEAGRVVQDQERYVVIFKGSSGAAGGFLQKLMGRGVSPLECAISSDDVEDIFLKVGAREVA